MAFSGTPGLPGMSGMSGMSANDVVLTDRNGRNIAVSREALGGLTPQEYNRRALLRRSTME